MTGGTLYVWGDEGAVHPEYVRPSVLDALDEQRLLELLKQHHEETASPRARHVLDHWSTEKLRMRKYTPRTTLLRVVTVDQPAAVNPA